MSYRKFLFGISMVCICAVFTHCKTKPVSLVVQEISSDTGYDLSSIYMVDDSVGFIVGGSRYDIGIVLKATDAGDSWSIDSISPKRLYGVHFTADRTGFVVGFDGKIFGTKDDGQFWTLLESAFVPLYDVSFADDKNGVAVGGAGYKQGYIMRTNDGGDTWSLETIGRELRTIIFINDTMGFIGGYGVVMKTEDAGATWDTTDARGDFFVSIDYSKPIGLYAAGSNGSVIRSQDKGETWTTQINGNTHVINRFSFRAIQVLYGPYAYVVGKNGKIMSVYSNGSKWSNEKRFTEMHLNDVSIQPSGLNIAVGDGGVIYKFF